MSSADVVEIDKGDWPPFDPWQLMAVAGGSAVAMGATVLLLAWDFPTVVFMMVALLTAGGAVWMRPRSPAILLAAAAVALLVSLQMRPAWNLPALFGPRPVVNQPDPTAWDSARAVTFVLAGLAVFAAAMVSLPSGIGWLLARSKESPGKKNLELRERGEAIGRQLSRAIISVFVMIHFTGISCAFLSVPPPNRDQSWLAQWGWTALQPYLQFMYLINAYRFYSPEPGPASVLWYYIEYADGTIREVRIPNRSQHNLDPLGQEYTRRLSIGESTNQLMPIPSIPDPVKHRRITWGDPKFNEHLKTPIPLHPPPLWHDAQYRVPQEHSRRLLCEYARRAAQQFPHSDTDPSKGVVAVKIYRVTHRMLDPWEMAVAENEPTADWTYMPFYQGEFVKPEPRPGQPEDPNEPWVLSNPDDPFLYWLIPIWVEQRANFDPNNPQAPPGSLGYKPHVVDCLKVHVELKTKREGAKP